MIEKSYSRLRRGRVLAGLLDQFENRRHLRLWRLENSINHLLPIVFSNESLHVEPLKPAIEYLAARAVLTIDPTALPTILELYFVPKHPAANRAVVVLVNGHF